jgi:predicted NBD/HSP70 family sugar kinase
MGVANSAADQLTVRRSNLSLVLRRLRAAGPRSRARLATETGLNKATVSSLVTELVDRGLVVEGDVERGNVGRPAQAVAVAGRVCGLGVEINVDYVAVHVLDLRGEDVSARRIAVDVPALSPGHTLDLMADLVNSVIVDVRDRGHHVVGVGAAVPGLIETGPGLLRFGPNLGWRGLEVASELSARLTESSARVAVDNDANLAALAEYAMGGSAGAPDLVYLTGEVGVGAGVIVGGQLMRGSRGFGGEIGHLALAPDGHLCGCGRRGCWETVAGLSALLRSVASPGDVIADPSVDLEVRLAEIRRRAERGDDRTLRGLGEIGVGLGLGTSILVNILNPEVIVLGGFFSVLYDFLLPEMKVVLAERAVAPGAGGCRIEPSTLGFTAAARGGAHIVLESVLTDPTSVDVPENSQPEAVHTSGGVS